MCVCVQLVSNVCALLGTGFIAELCLRIMCTLYNIIVIILTLSMSIVISIENHVASKSDFMTCAAMQLALTHLNVTSEILAH